MQKYSELLETYENERDIPYGKLLETEEWSSKREGILERDDGRCIKCRRTSTFLVPGRGYVLSQQFQSSNILFPELKEEVSELKDVESPLCLHVHHAYYVLSRTPWNYPDDALSTLCSDCHENLHKEQHVPVYKTEAKREKLSLTPCSRCGGKGAIPEYNHVQSGICFRCEGARFDERIRS